MQRGQSQASLVPSDKARGNRYRLKHERLPLNTRKYYFIMTKHWHRLPGEVMEFPSLTVFKSLLDMAMATGSVCSGLSRELVQMASGDLSQAAVILWNPLADGFDHLHQFKTWVICDTTTLNKALWKKPQNNQFRSLWLVSLFPFYIPFDQSSWSKGRLTPHFWKKFPERNLVIFMC